ncbi:carbohydrate sulfotransferase 4-like [Haliotis rubra]|uniref:carbohydrate sulfotransferase 4-like n=1 Tax=Haliotis rubra TaxID=36100 RepID=UPI001EE50FB7|nr:carbohydrate sulfotransferase 4-like [Haliotis rubra]
MVELGVEWQETGYFVKSGNQLVQAQLLSQRWVVQNKLQMVLLTAIIAATLVLNNYNLAEDQKTLVVVLTYMRSGSSFTGDIIQMNPEVFYVFEPLLHHARRTNQSSLDALKYSKTCESTLENFLVCNMTESDTYTQQRSQMRLSLDTMNYYFCTLEQGPNSEGCFHLLEKACLRSRVSCVKTIRYSMKNMTHLMEKHGNMKIIHLIRDPRATLLSQHKLQEFKIDSLGKFAALLCNRAKMDFDDSLFMKKQFPGRIATIRYEDLAEMPLNIAEQMYNFIGLDFTDENRDHIQHVTTRNGGCGAYCRRRNSTVTMSLWRTRLTYMQVSLIDKICQPLYRVMGYLPVQNQEHLLDMSLPMYADVPTESRVMDYQSINS